MFLLDSILHDIEPQKQMTTRLPLSSLYSFQLKAVSISDVGSDGKNKLFQEAFMLFYSIEQEFFFPKLSDFSETVCTAELLFLELKIKFRNHGRRMKEERRSQGWAICEFVSSPARDLQPGFTKRRWRSFCSVMTS